MLQTVECLLKMNVELLFWFIVFVSDELCYRFVQMVEGKSYCVELSGNLVPMAASSTQLGITVRAFHVNRLSFVVKISDPSQRPNGCLRFLPATKLLHSMEIQEHGREVCLLPVSLVEMAITDLVPEQEPDDLVRNFEVARQQAGEWNL